MKRYFSILLVALLSLGVLAGCNQSHNEPGNNGKKQQTTVVGVDKPSSTPNATETTKVTTGNTAPKATKASTAKQGVKVAAPSAQQAAKGYLLVVSRFEKGSAGTSLKLAKTATAVLQFAAANDISNCDAKKTRVNMTTAWEKTLSEEDRDNFDDNFPDVVQFLLTAKENPADVQGLLEDAGVAEAFNKVAKQKGVWDDWNALQVYTLDMGAVAEVDD